MKSKYLILFLLVLNTLLILLLLKITLSDLISLVSLIISFISLFLTLIVVINAKQFLKPFQAKGIFRTSNMGIKFFQSGIQREVEGDKYQ